MHKLAVFPIGRVATSLATALAFCSTQAGAANYSCTLALGNQTSADVSISRTGDGFTGLSMSLVQLIGESMHECELGGTAEGAAWPVRGKSHITIGKLDGEGTDGAYAVALAPDGPGRWQVALASPKGGGDLYCGSMLLPRGFALTLGKNGACTALRPRWR